MPEVEIKSKDDLKKLEGWKIKSATEEQGPNGVVQLVLEMQHPAAEGDIKLVISPKSEVMVQGVRVVMNPVINIKSIDA